MKTFEFEDNGRKIILVIKEKYEDGSGGKCIVDLCIDNKVIAEDAKAWIHSDKRLKYKCYLDVENPASKQIYSVCICNLRNENVFSTPDSIMKSKEITDYIFYHIEPFTSIYAKTYRFSVRAYVNRSRRKYVNDLSKKQNNKEGALNA